MAKRVELLSHGLFEKKLMDSKVTTRTVTKKEKIFGHLIGPLGLIFVVNTIAALVEKYFTQQATAMYGEGNPMLQTMGGYYEIVMTVAKILAVGIGLLNGFLIQHTKSKQGRFRPWYLIFGFVSIAIGALIFLFAGEPAKAMGNAYWYYFFFMLICYHTVGSSFFYLFRDSIVSVATHNAKEKAQLKFIRMVSWTLISGIVIGMLVSTVLIPFWLEKSLSGYFILLIILSIVAVPLLLMEYFFTKERVIEDVAQEVGLENENKIPLKQQMKALMTNKYFVILMVLTTIGGIIDNFKGGNVQYFYVKFMLDGVNHGERFMMFSIITGIPLGLGAIGIYPLARKIGIKNLSIIGYSLILVGAIIGWIFPSNLYVVYAAGFLKQIGYLPHAYIFATLLCYAYDDIEFKSGLRLEGLMGVAIIVAIQQLLYAPCAGGYESILLKLGFADGEGIMASETVQGFMTMAFYLCDIILAVAALILLPFVDVEKKLPTINAELEQRMKEAVLARGEEWVSPEEQEKREAEQAEREHEENRIADLRERCQRKGLDFDTENQKYLTNKAEKERKWKEKQDAKKAKKEAREQAKKK